MCVLCPRRSIKERTNSDRIRYENKYFFLVLVVSGSSSFLTQPPPSTIRPDPQCGVSKGCLVDCKEGPCTYQTSWEYTPGATDVLFEVQYIIANVSDAWVAIAFSTTPTMVNNSVIACVLNNGQVFVAQSYNADHDNQPIINVTLGIKVESTSYNDSIIHCKYRRNITINDSTGKVFSLNNPLYLILGTGPAHNGQLQKHQQDPIVTPVLVDFKRTEWTTQSPTTPPSPRSIVPDPQCGVSKGCMDKCKDGSCTYLASWQYVSSFDYIEFELQYKTQNVGDNWAAIAFSTEQIMKNNSVIACITNNSDVSVLLSYNTNHANQPISNASLGLTLEIAEFTDSIIHCKFKRAVIVNDPTGMIFNLNNPLYLFVGTGPATNGKLNFHTTTPDMSSGLVNFKQTVWTTPDPTTPPSPRSIVPDPQCGVSKGCMDKCKDGTCTYLASWQYVSGSDYIEFELQYKTQNVGDNWAAIAFSTQQVMKNNSVIACITNNSDVSVLQSYNTDHANQPISNASLGLTLEIADFTDSIIHCKFKRAVTVNDSSGMIFNLDNTLYLFVGTGPAPNGKLSIHTTTPDISPGLVDFKQTVWTTPGPTKPPGVITLDPECKKSKGCFYDDNADHLTYLITWKPLNDTIEFQIEAIVGTGDRWAAIAFAPTSKMSGSSVIACANSKGSVTVLQSYNDGHNNERIKNESSGITQIKTSIQDSVIRCTFKREINVGVNQNQLFNLNQKWYMLFAHGPYSASTGRLQKHTQEPVSSPSKINFTSTDSFTGKTSSDIILVQIHGCLMIVGWMCFSSIGVVVARYYKKQWPKLAPLHHKVWFLMHRTCMMAAVLCTCASFVIIFVKVGGFSQLFPPDDKIYVKSHPILGIAVTALTVINPMMAMCRPKPNDKSRPIFNWCHWAVGTLAHLAASVNIVFGLQIDESAAPMEATYAVIVYASIFVIVEGLLELNQKVSAKDYYMDESTQLINKFDEATEHSQFKSVLLYKHILSMIGCSAATIILLIKNWGYI